MKKNILRILALAMTVMLILGSMALAEDEKKTFSYWVPFAGGTTAKQYISNYSEHTSYIERENRTGVHIEFEHPTTGEEKEQFNLMIASGILPDMVSDVDTYYVGGSLAAIDDGLFVDVTEYINEENTPNLCYLMELNPALKNELFSDDGTFIGFPMITIGSDQSGESIMPGPLSPWGGPMLRSDWLEEVGMEVPTTIGEWYEVLKAIKEKINPEVLLHFSTESPAKLVGAFGIFVGAYNIGPTFYQVDGEVKFGPAQEAYKAYLTEMAKWYAEGLIDPEYATRDSSSMTSMINNGQVAATWRQAVSFIDKQAGQYGNAWVAAPYPDLEKGVEHKWRFSNNIARGHVTLISTSCADVLGAIKWIDYGYSKEGARLMTMGVEGVDYNGYNELGQPIYVEKYMANNGAERSNYSGVSYLTDGTFLRYPNEMMSITYFDPTNYAIPQLWMGDTSYVMPPVTLTTEESTEVGAIMADVYTHVNELTSKFIMGIEPLDNFESYVNALETMGLSRAVSIYQDALNRYLAR